jgi:UDP-N-acetylmuramoyl-tripeptide--D-alanyl-D-alanine ligase
VGRNFKNWNNQLGLPLSMLGFTGRETFWVLEAGINYAGEMDLLGQIVQPDMAIINNIGPVHLEGLKSLRGVAEEKAGLLAHLRPDGRAIISQDYPELVEASAKQAAGRTVFFSLREERCPYYGQYLGPTEEGGGSYRISLKGRRTEVRLGYQGWFLLENLLAAATAASELGVEPEAIGRGLAEAELPEHRCRLQRCGEYLVVDDCYNANPLSMRRAIDMAVEAAQGGPCVAVLGDMKELGQQAAEEHKALGAYLAEKSVQAVFFVGEHLEDIRAGYSQSGEPSRVLGLQTEDDLRRGLQGCQVMGGTVLVKGSRGCRMERFVEALAGGVGR